VSYCFYWFRISHSDFNDISSVAALFAGEDALPIPYKIELNKEIGTIQTVPHGKMGREDSELPPDVLFSDIELKVLHAFAKKNAARRL